MPSPRAVLADITEFKLDPTKPHHVKGNRLLPKTHASLETVTVSIEQPLPVVVDTAKVEEMVVEVPAQVLPEETKVEEVTSKSLIPEHVILFQDMFPEIEATNVDLETTPPPAIEVLPEVPVSEPVVVKSKPQSLIVSNKKRNQKA